MQKQPPNELYKKVVQGRFAIFTEKHLCWSLFMIKLPLATTYFQEHLRTTTFLYGAVAHDSETFVFTKLY